MVLSLRQILNILVLPCSTVLLTKILTDNPAPGSIWDWELWTWPIWNTGELLAVVVALAFAFRAWRKDKRKEKTQEKAARLRLRYEVWRNLKELDPLRKLDAFARSILRQPPGQLPEEMYDSWWQPEIIEEVIRVFRKSPVQPDESVRNRLEEQFELFARTINVDEMGDLDEFYNGMHHIHKLEASFAKFLGGAIGGPEFDEKLGGLLRETMRVYDIGVRLQKSLDESQRKNEHSGQP
jgi:hypothetical protein